MNNDEKKFPEQHAPDKNTDHAFVQVGKDGQPVIPTTTTGEKENQSVEKETGKKPSTDSN